MPLEMVTLPNLRDTVPSVSRQYSAPRSGSPSKSMVPAHSRPAGSHLPSLNRLAGMSRSGSAIGRISPLSGSRLAKPLCSATTKPPEARGTTVPTACKVSISRFSPVAGSYTNSFCPMMSTQ